MLREPPIVNTFMMETKNLMRDKNRMQGSSPGEYVYIQAPLTQMGRMDESQRSMRRAKMTNAHGGHP